MKSMFLIVACLAASSFNARAGNDLDQLRALVQSEFADLSKDLGAALSYKPVSPSIALGLTGFDLGVEITATELAHSELLDKASSGSATNVLPVPKLHLHKGLPLDFDIGASVAWVPGSDIRVWGGEVRYAIVNGGLVTPTIALRGSFSTLQGVDQLDFDTYGVDLSISKGLVNVTPYAGIGAVYVDSSPNGVAGLKGETSTLSKVYGGLNVNFLIGNLAAEIDRTGKSTTLGLKFGWRF